MTLPDPAIGAAAPPASPAPAPLQAPPPPAAPPALAGPAPAALAGPAPGPARSPRRASGGSFDAVVLGAGLAGAAAAWALALSGVRRVLVLEREALPGVHASGRNAAMVRRLVAEPALAGLALEGARFIEAGAPGLPESPAYRRSGGLLLAEGAALAPLARAAETARRAGVLVDEVAADEVARRFPFLAAAPTPARGLFVAADGVVDVAGLLHGYLAAARAGGAEVAFDEPLVDIEVEAARVVGVRTTRRRVAAPLVIDAAGAWAEEIAARAGATRPGLRALRRHLFFARAEPASEPRALAGPPAAAAPLFALQADPGGRAARPSSSALGLGPDAPWIWHEQAGYYVRPEAGGLLLCGCDEDEVPPGSPIAIPAAEEALAAKLAREAPALAELPIARRWAGLRTFAPDRLPVIGADPLLDGLVWLAGLGGHGVTVSASAGRLAAALACGDAPPPEALAFAPGRAARAPAGAPSTGALAAPAPPPAGALAGSAPRRAHTEEEGPL